MSDPNNNISSIRINQCGYLASLPKYIAVTEEAPVNVYDNTGSIIKSFNDIKLSFDEASGDNVAVIDLGDLPAGDYKISCGDSSRTISVNDKPYDKLTDALIKALYFQRCGCALEEKYAGRFTHAACHTAPVPEWVAVNHVENSESISDEDKKSSVFKIFSNESKTVPGGWHDAGDFGKYVGPGAVTVAHMLYAWLLFPKGCSNDLNIPETGNGTPDILNEARWELDWILRMQRSDGAFYHKLTKAKFAPFIMPEDDKEPEYLMPVSHCATAAAVAVLALASRIYRPFDGTFSENALSAALRGFDWLVANPGFIPFRNPDGVNTGMYGDWSVKDELFWACCELFATTGDEKYRNEAESIYKYARAVIIEKENDPEDNSESVIIKTPEPDAGCIFGAILKREAGLFEEFRKRFKGRSFFRLPKHTGLNVTQYGWSDVSGLGAICCLFDLKEKAGKVLFDELRTDFLGRSAEALERVNSSGYRTSLLSGEYVWGSVLTVMSNSMSMLLNYLLTGNKEMLAGSLSQLDYALGLNALDLSFITGFGERSVRNPHHRPSGSDNIDDPVPGFISGGPNKAWTYPETKERLKDTPAAKYFLDETPSADTNEVAIYWNSPVIFIAAYFNSL